MQAVASRADRRRARTVERLVDASAEVFGRRGVAAATIADITDTADLGLGTFYNYFEGKDAILAAATDKAARLLCSELRTAVEAAPNPAEGLLALVSELFAWYDRQAVWGPFLLTVGLTNETLGQEFGGLLFELVRRGVEASLFEEQDAWLAPITITGVLVAALHFRERGLLDAAAAAGVAHQILRLVGAAVTVP